MIASSRPLRFLALTLGGWTALRVALLWPTIDSLPAAMDAIVPIPRALAEETSRRPRATALVIAIPPRAVRTQVAGPNPGAMARTIAITLPPPVTAAPQLAIALTAPVTDDKAFVAASPVPFVDRPVLASSPDRLSASGWLIARAGRAVPFAGQLGGSQAGMRLTYALGDERRLALSARLSSALGSRQREAALGFDWQPTRLPLHLFAEQRIGIEQARGGPSVGLIAGLPPTPLPAGFRLEGYGQAGGIARGGIEGFADGALRLARPLAEFGGMKLDLGAGAWGGAQRGARRLDIGPSLGLTLPVTGRALRLSLDWRQRIAGHAAPGSGPALSLGSDF